MKTQGFNDLLKKLSITLIIMLFIRLGNLIPVPDLNMIDSLSYIVTDPITKEFITTFSNKKTFVIGLFTLGIFPYINASILTQVIFSYSPSLAQLQKEKDLSSRRKINLITRTITLIAAIIQSLGIAYYFKPILSNWNLALALKIILWLTTGAIIILWLCEIITDYGLGNGPSIFVFTNIVSNFPSFSKLISFGIFEKSNFYLTASIFILTSFLLIGFIFLQSGVRKIFIVSSRELNVPVPDISRNVSNYILLKLNQAGIIPIILATTILIVPNFFFNSESMKDLFLQINLSNRYLEIFSKFLYWLGYFGFILTFSSYYATMSLNPKSISDQLQKTTAAIPECRPGPSTTFYIQQVSQRLNTLGSSLLAIIATLPTIFDTLLGLKSLNGLSATSLLIVVGVIFDVIREIDDTRYSSIYKVN